MRPQTLDEESQERADEIVKDYNKARNLPGTIIGRKRLRDMRIFLNRLGIEVHIPMNSAAFTAAYCKKYANEESADLRTWGPQSL